MKRIGYLFDSVCAPDNLRLAFWKASRGKRHREDQRAFAARLERNLAELRLGLIDGSYPVGNYRHFTVYEPKKREIYAAAFPERVLHHALMNVCGPWIERWLIHDSYACRLGKGQWRALDRARHFASRFGWYMKGDIKKYFASIPHGKLRQMLEGKFKDVRLLEWFGRIIATHEDRPGYGLPIGNLTSQHWANLFLDPLDRLPGLPYVRYMDDFVVWSDDKERLKRLRGEIDRVVGSLGLELKGRLFINRTVLGMDFLGARVFPGAIRMSRDGKRRYAQKANRYAYLLGHGDLSPEEYQMRMTALTACTLRIDSAAWRRKFFFGDRREASGADRVKRGGSWNNDPANCRSANRNSNAPSTVNNDIGLRLVCSAAPQSGDCSPRRSPVPGFRTKTQ